MIIGVDYYPEQCDESCWPTDVDLMTKAGISLVRMAEFSWSRLEPQSGRLDFSWLDRVLGLLHDAGVQAVLGTPTATPPAWLHAQYPDIYPADKRKYRLGFGTREQRCLNNDAMRLHSRRIVTELVRHYADHPAVIGWQTDNELTANLCYCPLCAEKYQAWLSTKYGSLAELNRAWGTSFWSQEYTDWAQIPLPWEVKCGDYHNPSLQLEYRRFQSETTVTFQREQVEIIRKRAPRHFITHNMMGVHNAMDYYALGHDLDFVSWDNYPDNPWGREPYGMPLAADVMRGIKQKNVWVMEQQNGITGWNKMGRRPSGAWLRCAAWQAIAHGADALVFFRWRTACHGTEQYWHGVINHDGVPRRRYREVADLCRETREMSEALAGTAPRAEVAILNSYEQHYAFDIQPQADGLRPWDQVARYYRVLRRVGLNVDIVPPTVDLAQYKVVIVPSWYIMREEDALRLRNYADQGGTLVLNPRTGVKNAVNACYEEPIPFGLREVAGLEIDDYDPLGNDKTEIRGRDGKTYTVSVWADAPLLSGAEAMAHYCGSVYPGEPALTRHHYGSGVVYYCCTYGDADFYADLLTQVLDGAEVRGRMQVPEGVDVYWRENEGARYLFLVNFTDTRQTVDVGHELDLLLGETPEKGAVTLPAYGVGIYRSETCVRTAGAPLRGRRAVAANI